MIDYLVLVLEVKLLVLIVYLLNAYTINQRAYDGSKSWLVVDEVKSWLVVDEVTIRFVVVFVLVLLVLLCFCPLVLMYARK